MKRLKLKVNKKQIIIIISLVLLIVLFICFMLNKLPNVGKIKNGKAEYIDKIANVTKYKDKIIIEFENDLELIDNCVMTTEIYNKFKNNDSLYNISVKDYAKLSTLTAKESYNINKSMQLKLVDEDDKYTKYFAKTCGFDSKNELMKYTKAVMKLASKEK